MLPSKPIKKSTCWTVRSEMDGDGRVFTIRAKKAITENQMVDCLNRWKEENLTFAAPEPVLHEIHYETWRPEPQ